MKKIYLAGKIAKNDWRRIRGEWDYAWSEGLPEWPVVRGHVHGMDYVGPFFMSCDHGCAHGPASHGVGATVEGECSGYQLFPHQTVRRCFEAIKQADIFFAWIDDNDPSVVTDAYGTLVEIGYASALGKEIIIAAPNLIGEYEPRHSGDHPGFDELWFAFHCADHVIRSDDPWQALREVADLYTARLESPLEELFWKVYIDNRPAVLRGLVTQHKVTAGGNNYRLDFAIPDRKLAFEVDGYTYHSDQESWSRDRKRDLDLSMDGWRIHRLPGNLVRNDPIGAIAIARKIAEAP